MTAHHGRYVAYYRVSTRRQGESGLGLDAQKSAVQSYLNGGRWTLLKEYTEVESGKNNDRPQLAKAIHHAKVTGAKLIIAKLDRLSRDAAFLLALQNSGTKFVAADMPEANETVVGLMAILAQDEARRISQRTKAALAEAKKRGVKLGNPHGARALRRWKARELAAGRDPLDRLVRVTVEKASRFALDVRPILEDIEEHGITTLRGIAEELNRREIRTPRGEVGKWTYTTVDRVKRRLGL